jgi:hypothetical protein
MSSVAAVISLAIRIKLTSQSGEVAVAPAVEVTAIGVGWRVVMMVGIKDSWRAKKL